MTSRLAICCEKCLIKRKVEPKASSKIEALGGRNDYLYLLKYITWPIAYYKQ
jgi:hypothetical protein